MAITIVSPKLVSAAPTLINTGIELFVSMPLINGGTEFAPNVFITGFTVASAPRLSPVSFPVFVGNLAAGNNGATNARFGALGLIPGQKYLLTVRGFYGAEGSQIGFSVNRYVTIPVPSAYPVDLLRARVQALVQTSTWNYTIYNDEPESSQQFLAGFSLTIAAPVIVTGTPPGWIVETDNATYVGWIAADENFPYPNHVRPGDTLGGFQIQSPTGYSESTPYVLTSWRQDTDESGLVAPDVVVTPRRTL
ncbi:hypothetical protein [Candidatus Nitrotoga sp. AM1P]|uniref:hypothetical protein n=1 Tax=Candidatus Nitrotoga sp. AM1P TaxID=2559597 RepID=UPI0010BC08B3|nr:hypothetical protein [Candidatus Nitrotoga sp. AM1P]BBJ22128.1 hypothetical protein W01_00550 [Candidatus Nitrotoga sp. AM1P]